ncbi:membrane protein [Hymenobacter cavernae]|uniref:Membrane protein n=2 Tax=Hymenobacter cavernae TaxID=2044852 RepID=A0ABQ1UBX0_9BACT|nr:membrane protein [Hymenobacter cavernae]
MLSACKKDDFLEPKTSALTEQTVFSDSTRTMAFLSRIYADAGFSFQKLRWSNHGNTELATDDAEYVFSGTGQVAVQLYSGIVTPLAFMGNGTAFSTSDASDFWVTPWANIRRVNLLMSQLPRTPLSKKMQARVTAEARFLRAWYYHYLLVTFGGVPIVGDKVYGIEDVIDMPRTSYADGIDYLTAELDEIAPQLPIAAEYSAPDYGRVTRGACLALKSRILLQAASPLFNGGAETSDASLAALVSYPSTDPSRWQKAADAAKAVIDLGTYSLNEDNVTKPGYGFYSVFLRRVNSEYIFAYHRPANKDMELYYNPSTRGGNKYSMPTQNIVDAFPMRNGKAITDPTSGYNAANPYVGRDPRFNYTIIYNGSSYYLSSAGRAAPVYTYEGAPTDGFDVTTSATGYYGRKMCDSTTSQGGGSNTERSWPLIRLAEVKLNYAEALNELGRTEDAMAQIFDIRRRAGITPGSPARYGIKSGISQSEARELIRNERHIELAYEDHRWNDIRRWKTAMVISNAYNNRMRITNRGTTAAPGPYTYNVVPTIRRHNFRPEMYLLPIPDAEIRKVPQMRQNPGW